MVTKKNLTQTDEAGLRLYCPDGHRIYWTRANREYRSKTEYGRLNGWRSESGGVCSAGLWWKQHDTPVQRENKWIRDSPLVVAKAPSLAQDNTRILSGHSGIGMYSVKIDVRGTRHIDCAMRCGNFRFWYGHENLPPHDDIDTSKVVTEEDWKNLVALVAERGWTFDQGIRCPRCQDEYKAWENYFNESIARAKALEEEAVNA